MKKHTSPAIVSIPPKIKSRFNVRAGLVICLLTMCLGIHAQNTNVSGIVNSYAAVTSISSQNCSSVLGVDSPAGFHSGDTVIIMQMKGAVIDTSDTPTFGNVINRNGAGHYEYNTTNHISGHSIYLNGLLGSVFDLSGSVQIIRTPNYTNITVTGGALTAKKWDGASGGVLALFVSGSITMYSDIDVSGLGFRGGNISNNPDGNCGNGSPDFFYPLSQGNVTVWDSGGAEKGEGITILDTNKMAGKGKLANGGGGGNKHNYGGGGGSNYTAGGQGGNALDGCGTGNMGIGGVSLVPFISKDTLFMGGGGGCGDFNNNVGSIGADGGGIVIIKASTLNGNGHNINANGNDELVIGSGIADGVGGGGGGGSLYLDIASFSSPVSISVNGGHGGDQDPSYGCVGTGGGGGVGVVMLTASPVPSGVTISNYPGRAGIFLTTAFSDCAGTSYGATAGDSAQNGIKTNVSPIGITINQHGVTINPTQYAAICHGGTLTLNSGIDSAQYFWQDGSTDSTYVVSSPGTYWVSSTRNGCTNIDTIIVNLITKVIVDLGNDTTYCGSFSRILSTGLSATRWNTGITGPSIIASAPGLYWAQDSNQCGVSRDSITLSEKPLPTKNLAHDSTLCIGETLVLNAGNPGATYKWQDGSTGNLYSVTSSGTYWVSITLNGCSDVDSALIDFVSKPVVRLGNDSTYCGSFSRTLATGILMTEWSTGAIDSSIIVSAPGLYWAEDSNQCGAVRDSINLFERPLPIVHLGDDTSLCSGKTLTLNAGNPGSSFLWQDNSTNQTYLVIDSGTYWVRVTTDSCSNADTVSVSYKSPPHQFTLGNDTTICEDSSIVLNAYQSQASYYIWSTEDTSSFIRVNQAGRYYVIDSNACGSDSASVVIATEQCICQLIVPSAFSPNNDGKNDQFGVVYQCPIQTFAMNIYNRWGQLVFGTHSIMDKWDGMYKGEAQPLGVYIYMVSYIDPYTKAEKALSGNVTLLR